MLMTFWLGIMEVLVSKYWMTLYLNYMLEGFLAGSHLKGIRSTTSRNSVCIFQIGKLFVTVSILLSSAKKD